jgi:hypothetical protein
MAKAKGTTLIGAVKFLRSRREEARRVLPEHLQHYLDETISTSAWFPENDLLGLIRAMLELISGPADETLEMMGRATARMHQEGVYAHLLEHGPTRNTTFALWSSQHDTGTLTVTEEGPCVNRVDLVDYATPSPEMCAIVGAYVNETIRMGGLNAKTEEVACRRSGAERCSWRCTWDSDDEVS